MRSCASRTANSPGRAWNRSSLPRSDALRDIGVASTGSAQGPARGRGRGEHVALCGQHAATARIRLRGHGAALDPGFEILDRIDDPPAELVIGRTGALSAVLFEGPRGQAEKLRSLHGAQIARRQGSVIGSHRKPPWGP